MMPRTPLPWHLRWRRRRKPRAQESILPRRRRLSFPYQPPPAAPTQPRHAQWPVVVFPKRHRVEVGQAALDARLLLNLAALQVRGEVQLGLVPAPLLVVERVPLAPDPHPGGVAPLAISTAGASGDAALAGTLCHAPIVPAARGSINSRLPGAARVRWRARFAPGRWPTGPASRLLSRPFRLSAQSLSCPAVRWMPGPARQPAKGQARHPSVLGGPSGWASGAPARDGRQPAAPARLAGPPASRPRATTTPPPAPCSARTWTPQAQFKKKKPPATYRYDSSLSPDLNWDGQNPDRELGEWLLAKIGEAAGRFMAEPPRFQTTRMQGVVMTHGHR